MGQALLTIQNLSAWYSEEKMILSGFSFSLAEHEVAGLIGLNVPRYEQETGSLFRHLQLWRELYT